MSKSNSGSTVTWNFGGLFLVAFLALKIGGNAYIATWSWWWLLMSCVPVIATIFKAVGLL